MPIGTFERISQLQETTDRINSHIRFYCDENARFKPKNPDDTEMIPAPSDEETMKRTKYEDSDNDSYIMGDRLDCQLGAKAWAHGFSGISRVYDMLAPEAKKPSTQPVERYTITVSKGFLQQPHESLKLTRLCSSATKFSARTRRRTGHTLSVSLQRLT